MEAARKAWVNVIDALKNDNLDKQQRAQLEGLRNDLIDAFPAIAKQGLDMPGATEVGEADFIIGSDGTGGASPGGSGIIGDLVRDVGQLLERRRRYRQNPAQQVQEMGRQ